jgi:carbon-monoxide dehydrogenase small subunit
MLIAATDLLARNGRPTREEIEDALSGQLCRCTGYTPIVDAIAEAAEA